MPRERPLQPEGEARRSPCRATVEKAARGAAGGEGRLLRRVHATEGLR